MRLNIDLFIKVFLISAVIGVGISYSKVYFFHIALVLLIVIYLMTNNSRIKVPSLPTNFHFFTLGMIMWYVLSLFWSVDYIHGIKTILYLVLGTSLVLSIVYYAQSIDHISKVFKTLGAIFTIEIIVCLLEVFTVFRMPISPFSNYVHLFGRENVFAEKIKFSIPLESLESVATGFNWNPNNVAVSMLILFPFFLLNKNLWIKFLGISSTLLIIYFSGSRGAMMGLGILFFFYVLFYRKSLKIHVLISMIFLGTILTLSSIDIKNSNSEKIRAIGTTIEAIQRYVSNEKSSTTESISVRKELIRQGMDAFYTSYGVGIGSGGTVAMLEKSGGVSDLKITSMHNFWIEILVEGGIIFFIIYVLWYLQIIVNLWKVSIHSKNSKLIFYSRSCSLSLIGLSIGVISASSVVYFLPMWILLGFSIATINLAKLERLQSI